MGGCRTCGGKLQIINNLRNQEVLNQVKELTQRIIDSKPIEELDQLDWIELYGMWHQLYPNASGEPTKEMLIEDLRNSQQYLKVRYTKSNVRR